MYGSMDTGSEKVQLNIVDVDGENGNQNASAPGFFEDPFDSDFWRAVHQKYEAGKVDGVVTKGWGNCLDEVRVERLKIKYEGLGQDPVVAMVADWYQQFQKQSHPDFLPSFERQISKLAELLIKQEHARSEKDSDDPKYKSHIVTDTDGVRKTLLHVAAEQNFVSIAQLLIDYYPGSLYVTTRGGDDLKRLPVELALLNFHDDVASLLIGKMLNERVRRLFEYNETEGRTRFKFKDYINKKDPYMKKTVIAVLDCLINPDWPYIPVEDEEVKESQWRKIPDLPIRYHFFYQLLDGDDEGRSPDNPDFNHKSSTCLRALCKSDHGEMIVRHPVVRMLARRKWHSFGRFWIRLYALVYVSYLFFLSFALLGAVKAEDPTKYKSSFDYFRLICEVITVAMAFVYFYLEADEMEKEGKDYMKDPFNFFDLFGICSIFALVPLRFLNISAQWALAATAYLVNFLRIFKFFPAWQFVGLYSKIMAKILSKDITKFAVVYIVILFGFSGSIYLSLKSVKGLSLVRGSFGEIVLRGFRALAEGKEFAEDYSSYNIYVTLLILVNMLGILVILVNILIAQLSFRYEEAQQNAKIQYDIDKTLIVTRIENSRYKESNKRLKYYTDGDFVNETSVVKELLSDWEGAHGKGKEDTMNEFRQMMQDIVKKED